MRCPKWAIEGGFPTPEPDESYRAFWARAGAADDVIDNGGALAALQPQVETLHERYCALAAMQGQHA